MAKKTKGTETTNATVIRFEKKKGGRGAGKDPSRKNAKKEPRYPETDMNLVLWLYRSGVEINRKKAVELTYLRYGRYVASLAKGYFGSFVSGGETVVSADDFVSAGMIGLIEALDHFDPKRGAFTTCCKPYVLSRMTEQACLASGIPTAHYMNVQKKLKRAIDSFAERNSVPSLKQLAETAGLTEKVTQIGLEMMRMLPVIPSGLCDYRSDDDPYVFPEIADSADTPEEAVLKKEFKTRLDRAIGRKLAVREGEAVRLMFGIDREEPQRGITTAKIAEMLGVSESGARYRIKKIIGGLGDDTELRDLAEGLLSRSDMTEKKTETFDVPLDAVVPVYVDGRDGRAAFADPVGALLDDIFSFDGTMCI